MAVQAANTYRESTDVINDATTAAMEATKEVELNLGEADLRGWLSRRFSSKS